MSTDYSELPNDLPVPKDDGGADHLPGSTLPELRLPSTLGGSVELAEPAHRWLVVYVYPRTGIPGEPSPNGWDDIPGARGCTPQSCAYRDSLAEFAALDASVIGISAQSPVEQREFAFVAEAGKVTGTFYPIFPPDRNASEVLAWLRQQT